jgi:hypothetical protein
VLRRDIPDDGAVLFGRNVGWRRRNIQRDRLCIGEGDIYHRADGPHDAVLFRDDDSNGAVMTPAFDLEDAKMRDNWRIQICPTCGKPLGAENDDCVTPGPDGSTYFGHPFDLPAIRLTK